LGEKPREEPRGEILISEGFVHQIKARVRLSLNGNGYIILIFDLA